MSTRSGHSGLSHLILRSSPGHELYRRKTAIENTRDIVTHCRQQSFKRSKTRKKHTKKSKIKTTLAKENKNEVTHGRNTEAGRASERELEVRKAQQTEQSSIYRKAWRAARPAFIVDCRLAGDKQRWQWLTGWQQTGHVHQSYTVFGF